MLRLGIEEKYSGCEAYLIWLCCGRVLASGLTYPGCKGLYGFGLLIIAAHHSSESN